MIRALIRGLAYTAATLAAGITLGIAGLIAILSTW